MPKVHPAMLAYVCGGLVVTGGTRKKGFQEESEATSGPVELAQVLEQAPPPQYEPVCLQKVLYATFLIIKQLARYSQPRAKK